jgi:hypothetical protein
MIYLAGVYAYLKQNKNFIHSSTKDNTRSLMYITQDCSLYNTPFSFIKTEYEFFSRTYGIKQSFGYRSEEI